MQIQGKVLIAELLSVSSDPFSKQVVLNKGSHDDLSAAADMWSAGVILYILMCGFPPFNARSHDELVQKIMTSPVNFGS